MNGPAIARSLDRGQVGLVVAAAALLGVAVVFGVSAAAAPTDRLGSDTANGTLVGIHGGGVGLHEDGSVRLLDGKGRTAYDISNANSYFEVYRLDDGRVLASFMNGDAEDCGPYPTPCARTGFRILDPEAEDPIDFEYTYPVRTEKNSETHDAELLPSGEFLLTDMEHERVFTVWRNGTVSWMWNASEMYDAPPDPTRTDWLHINDVDRLTEDRYLVSVRNANQLVVVERGEGVVDIVNEDGDPSLFRHQHNPQWLGPNAILVADSGNNRIVELHRNGSDADWEIAWELGGANDRGFAWPRDADRLRNGNTLITDSGNGRIVEVNASGAVVWSYTLPLNPYEAKRLPEGETVGGRQYGDTANITQTVAADGGDGVPVLSATFTTLRSGYPLPLWMTQWHLLVAVLGLLVAVGGGAVWGIERVRGVRGQRTGSL